MGNYKVRKAFSMALAVQSTATFQCNLNLSLFIRSSPKTLWRVIFTLETQANWLPDP